MGRGNTMARVARAKERLELAAQAQAEIAKQAVEAIDNGADPEIVVSIAQEAVKEIQLPPITINRAQEEIDRQNEIAIKQASDTKDLQGQEQISIQFLNRSEYPPVLLRKGSTKSGKRFEVFFDAEGLAIVPREVGEHLVVNSNGKIIYSEK
jgi:hypothetical protein